MDQLLADLKDHHPDVAKVVGSVVVDAHHTTENQLLARAGSSTPSTTGSRPGSSPFSCHADHSGDGIVRSLITRSGQGYRLLHGPADEAERHDQRLGGN